jgi:hypothetical protein
LKAFSRVSLPSPHPLSHTALSLSFSVASLSLLVEKMLDPLPLELANLPVTWTSLHLVPGSDAQNDRNDPLELSAETRPFSLPLLGSCSSSGSPDPFTYGHADATMYSHRFSTGHRLNERFTRSYILREEIGSGGYGFVMVASRRTSPGDVAVKFIIRKKVPSHAWVQDSKLGLLPTEIWLLSRIQHPNVADFLEYFEDDVYYYLVRSIVRNTFGVAQLLRKGSRTSWFSLGLKTRVRNGW